MNLAVETSKYEVPKAKSKRRLKVVDKATPVLHLFFEVYMGNGHAGLAEIARKKKIYIENLAPEQYVVFLNAQMNAAKMFASNNVVAYIKIPNGRLTADVLSRIPTVFGGKAIKYSDSQKAQIEAALQ